MAQNYDFVAIGGGSAGYNAARVAAGLGKRVAIIDGARDLGGLCILKGCMPSKALIYAAEVMHLAKNSRLFGLHIGEAAVDMKAIHRWKSDIIGGFAKHRVKQLKTGNWELIRAQARFLDAHTIELDNGKTVRASNFLIGTGSRVAVPPLPGLALAPYWTSDDVLDLEFKPRSTIVLGGGIVACELAQFLARIGTRVCIIQRNPTLLRKNSKEAGSVVRSAFEAEGIEVVTNSKILRISTSRFGISVTFEQDGKSKTRRADHLLNALGREPNTHGLSLDKAGVSTLSNGRIVTDRWQQTSARNIYAAGDCCGPHEIVHVAIQQAELAARHASGIKGLKPIDNSMLLSVVFTDPQVASVGWTAEDLTRKRIPFETASHPFNDHGKSIIMNANFGFIRVFAHAGNGRILGAEVVGKDAGELIHCFTTPISMRATVRDMLAAPWYHPTLAEALTYPLEEIADKLASRAVT